MPVRVLIVDDREPFRLAARDGRRRSPTVSKSSARAETGEDGVAMAADLAPTSC